MITKVRLLFCRVIPWQDQARASVNVHWVVGQSVDGVDLVDAVDSLSMGSKRVLLRLRLGVLAKVLDRDPSFYASTRPSCRQTRVISLSLRHDSPFPSTMVATLRVRNLRALSRS